jgi:hypothetical protein
MAQKRLRTPGLNESARSLQSDSVNTARMSGARCLGAASSMTLGRVSSTLSDWNSVLHVLSSFLSSVAALELTNVALHTLSHKVHFRAVHKYWTITEFRAGEPSGERVPKSSIIFREILSYWVVYFKWTSATLLVGKNYRLFSVTGGVTKGSYYRLYLLILYGQQYTQFT